MKEPLRQLDHCLADAPDARRKVLTRAEFVVACAFVLLLPAKGICQETEVLHPEKECQVKYALLYSFGLLTTWPADSFEPAADGPFIIGVLGAKPFPEYLARIAESKKIQGRKIVIRRFQAPEEVDRCHILYVTSGVSLEAEQAVARKFSDQPVLLVGERASETAGKAGVIEFVIEQGAVKFLLNAEAAKTRGLQIDPRLLKLAKRPSPPPQSTTSAVGQRP